MTVINGVLVILAVLAGLLGLCWLLLWWDGRREERYDERQKESMGTAYRMAFWAGILYFFLIMFFCRLEGPPDNTGLLILIGMMLMLMTWRFCCLLLRVGNPLFQDPKIAIGCDLYLIVTFLWDMFRWFRYEGTLVQADERFWFDTILSVCFILICVMDLAELRRDREE